MNKKGYTLIEILAALAIIVTVGVISVISLNAVLKSSRENSYNQLINDIKLATITYLTLYPDVEKNLYDSENKSLTIPISTLQGALLLDEDLKNPKTNQIMEISESEEDSASYNVEIEIDETMTFKYTLNGEEISSTNN